MRTQRSLVRYALKAAYTRRFGRERLPPSPPRDPFLGHLRQMGLDPLGFLLRARQTCGDVARLEMGRSDAFLVSHPDMAKHVLQEHHRNYDKGTPAFDALRMGFGNGILTSEGSLWLRQRRIMQPAFHKQRLAGFADAMTRSCERLARRWEDVPPDRAIDIAEEMSGLTLEIVSEVLFSADVGGAAERIGRAVTTLQADFHERLFGLFNAPMNVPTPANRRYARSISTLFDVVSGIIRARREQGAEARRDLLAMLMEARDEETGEQMPDDQLADEVRTLFVAGHETTASALAWTFYLLSQHPDARRRVEDEVARVLDGRSVTADDLPKLAFTKRVLMESMRLYPPAYLTGRRVVEDDTLGGYHVPRGSLVFVSPYVLHRHPAYWENPEGFDPDRFLPAASPSEARAPWAYIPFGGGPHICIGQGFAMMEAQVILATLAAHSRLDLVPGHRVVPDASVTLRPRGGIMATVRPTPRRAPAASAGGDRGRSAPISPGTQQPC